MDVTRRDGKIYSQLLIGTASQIAETVKVSAENALTYGETHDIHIRPIHPVNVVTLKDDE